MKKINYKIKFQLYGAIGLIDESKIPEIIELLKECESLIPDPKIINSIQDWSRKNKKGYELCESLINDILEHDLSTKQIAIINDLIDKLEKLAKERKESFWDTLRRWFNNATGTHV